MGVFLKNEGAGTPTPSPKRLKNHTRSLVAKTNVTLSHLEL